MRRKITGIILIAAALCFALVGCCEHTVESLEIDDGEWRQLYYVGDSFVPGTPFIAVYGDGYKYYGLIREDMISGFDTQTPGTKTITIEYEGFIAEKSINVVELNVDTFPETEIPDTDDNEELSLQHVNFELSQIFSEIGSPENLDIGRYLAPALYEIFDAASFGDHLFTDIAMILMYTNDGFSEMLKQAAAEFDFRTVTEENAVEAVKVLLKYADGNAMYSVTKALQFAAFGMDAGEMKGLLTYILKEIAASDDESGVSDGWSPEEKLMNYISVALCNAIDAEEGKVYSTAELRSMSELIANVAAEFLERGEAALTDIMQLLFGTDGLTEIGSKEYSSSEFCSTLAMIGKIGQRLSGGLITDKFFSYAFGDIAFELAETLAADGAYSPEAYAEDCVAMLYVADFVCDVMAAAEEGIPCNDPGAILQWLLFPSIPGVEIRFEAACDQIRELVGPV